MKLRTMNGRKGSLGPGDIIGFYSEFPYVIMKHGDERFMWPHTHDDKRIVPACIATGREEDRCEVIELFAAMMGLEVEPVELVCGPAYRLVEPKPLKGE